MAKKKKTNQYVKWGIIGAILLAILLLLATCDTVEQTLLPEDTNTTGGGGGTTEASSGGSSPGGTDDVVVEEVFVSDCGFQDTDGGIKLYDKGICNNLRSKTDFCSGSTLREFYIDESDCDAGCKYKDWSCEFGCSRGECQTEEQAFDEDLGCLDIDNNNICDDLQGCNDACEAKVLQPYQFGECLAYNPISPLSHEMTCVNSGGDYYLDTQSECGEDPICCCY